MTTYGQPVISRETRRLLVTIIVAVAVLWLLARLRFQDRPAPVPPVLAQLRPQSTYDDLARSLSDLRPSTSALLAVSESGVPALRVGTTIGIGVSTSNFILLPVPHRDTPSIKPWEPRIVDYPRYLIAAEVFDGGVSLRPIFVGSMAPIDSTIWNGSIWRLPSAVGASHGTFVFTTDGLFAGIVVHTIESPALLPAGLALDAANRLRSETSRARGDLGIEVRPTSLGLAVAWVDPNGPAAAYLFPTDVIEAMDGHEVPTLEHWRARAERVASGQQVTLRLRRNNTTRDEKITTAAATVPTANPSLGLRLRTRAQVGAEVLAVEPRSVAARAGVLAGDVITAVEGETAPTAARVRRMFDALAEGTTALAAITRNDEHHVIALRREALSETR